MLGPSQLTSVCPSMPQGLSTEGILAPETWFLCAEWWTHAIICSTFDFPLFGGTAVNLSGPWEGSCAPSLQSCGITQGWGREGLVGQTLGKTGMDG